MNTIGFQVDLSGIQNKGLHTIPAADFQHVLCEGATGAGKTASLILPTLADRLKRGHTVIFFDHKGHEHKKVKALAKEAGRLDDVVELGKPHGSYINLMAELDTIRLKEMIKVDASSKDIYWENSAANLLEDVLVPLRKLYTLIQLLNEHDLFGTVNATIFKKLEKFGIDIFEKPSFQTVASILSSPKQFLSYRKALQEIPDDLKRVLKRDDLPGNHRVHNKKDLLARILTFETSILSLDRFNLSEEGETASGNNGVFQVLNNSIASYAKKDYINIDEYTIPALMDKNAIIIIDTQSFGEDILKLLLESILKKSVMRLRTGTEREMSVFIDEANRVLYPSIDLHSDVLREAKVELVIAIQNQAQMINKFGETVWESVQSNIKHRYLIDINHEMYYNDRHTTSAPLLMEHSRLRDADLAFYARERNRVNIRKNFLGECDTLPESFTVLYDLDHFEHDASITIEDQFGEQYIMSYYGEHIMQKVGDAYPETPVGKPMSGIQIEIDLEESHPYDNLFAYEVDGEGIDNYTREKTHDTSIVYLNPSELEFEDEYEL